MRHTYRRLVLSTALLCWLTVPAAAEIRIVKTNGEPVPEGAATMTLNPKTGEWDIELLSLHSPGLESVYEIRANAGEIIDHVFINIEGPSAGSPVVVRVLGEAPGYLRTVRTIQQNGTAETILNRVNVLEDIGMVQVEVIGDLIAGRDILGPITATTADNTVRGISNARAGRHILGDISVENGRILLISAPNGNIGMPGSPVTIRAKHSVYHIEADNVYANVNTRVNGGAGGMFALDVHRFVGSIIAEQLIYNPWLGMQGLIYITDEFAGSITLGKSFNTTGQYIQVPVNGLTGQIIINADNAPGGAWTSPVRIGPNGHPNQIVLNTPSYTHSPVVLGGGAVGLVPFRLHNQGCSPANGSTVQFSPNETPLSVQLRHYGPVTRTGTSSLPFTIDRRLAGSGQTFAPAPIANFESVPSLTDGNVMIITAALNQPGFEAGYEYRIRPTSNVRCNIAGEPAVAWTGDYLITVLAAPCEGDVNNDGAVGVNDLLLIIGFWNQTAAAFPPADVTDDGIVNVNDLLAVINHWGSCQ